MKHLNRISKIQPVPADAVQDFVCFGAQALNAFLSLIGGILPFTTYIEDKCAIPVANDPGSGTTT